MTVFAVIIARLIKRTKVNRMKSMSVKDGMRTSLILISTHAACAVIGAAVVYFTSQPKGTASTIVKPISGAPLVVERTKIEKETVNITASYPGAGSSEIIIAKTDMPEARYWIEKVNGVSFVGGYDLSRQSYLQVMYWRRFGVFSIGAGASARIGERIEPGALVGVSYWW